MKPATELIHAGETDRGTAVPLTTPIYETATFVFENTQEVVAYNEGRSSKYLYSRYANPTVVSVERKLATLDRAETALLFSSGMGATATIVMTHARAGDEIVCSAAVYGGTLHLLNDLLTKFGLGRTLRVARGTGATGRRHRRANPHPLVRVAHQSDAALRRYPPDCGGLPEHGACSR